MTEAGPIVVVYHADCLDGLASAWVLAQAKGLRETRNAICIPYAHHDYKTAERNIYGLLGKANDFYFLDVAPTKDFLDELTEAPGKNIFIMDHHTTAFHNLKTYTPPQDSAARVDIDIDPLYHAAATLIWQRLMPGKEMPPLLQMIDKMDGSARGLETSDDFAAAAYIDTKNIDTLDDAFKSINLLASETFNDMAAKGRPILASQDKRIDDLFARADILNLQILPNSAPVEVPIVEARLQDYGRRLSTRLVELGKNYAGVAFAWAQRKNKSVTLSIRTDGSPDASRIAEYLGQTGSLKGNAGGHADAAALHFGSLTDFNARMGINPFSK